MKFTWIILALCLAHSLALPADFVIVDAVAEESLFDGSPLKSEISTSNPEQSQIPSQSDEVAPTSPLSVAGSPRGPAGVRPVARPGQARRQQKAGPEAVPDEVKQEVNIEAPVRKMPKIAPMRSQSGAGEEDGSTKGGRKSDASLHEFLKRRRQERLLATTEPDPLAILRGKEEVEPSAPVESANSKSSSRSFGGSRRSSTSNRKTDATTTTTTTTAKPSRNGAGANRFSPGRKSGRGSANEAPPAEVVEVSTEETSKAKFVPKRFSKKN